MPRMTAAAAARLREIEQIKPKIPQEWSARIDEMLTYMHAKRLAGHPGRFRHRHLTNAQLVQRGMSHLAELNQHLGLKRS
jgi:hypothetical protein